MNYFQFYLSTFYNVNFFLIFAAAMSLVVCVAVRDESKAPQSHQQASKTENKTEPLWSEDQFRKVYLEYRRCRVVLGFATSMARIIKQGGLVDPERRKRSAVRGYLAYLRMKGLARRYNSMSSRVLQLGELPGGLPERLDV